MKLFNTWFGGEFTIPYKMVSNTIGYTWYSNYSIK